MEKNVNICNNCGKSTYDRYGEVGWIAFEKCSEIKVFGGREHFDIKNPIGTLRWIHPTIENKEPMEFCCVECMLDFIYLKPTFYNKHGRTNLEEALSDSEDVVTKQKLNLIYKKIEKFIDKENNTNLSKETIDKSNKIEDVSNYVQVNYINPITGKETGTMMSVEVSKEHGITENGIAVYIPTSKNYRGDMEYSLRRYNKWKNLN
jgi:hypothetical protein